MRLKMICPACGSDRILMHESLWHEWSVEAQEWVVTRCDVWRMYCSECELTGGRSDDWSQLVDEVAA